VSNGPGTKFNLCGKYLILAVAGITLASLAVIAQGKAAPHAAQANTAPAKRMAFEVVSIRPSWRWLPEMETLETQPDGYRARAQPLISTIIFAYMPRSYYLTNENKILNQPGWTGDKYDIQAKVAPSDMAEWQKQGRMGGEMLSAMLRSMLEDRCKLAVHWVPGQTSGYALVVGKHGSKLKKATPPIPPNGIQVRVGDQNYPDARYFPHAKGDARTDVPFYNISMEALAGWLSMLFETPVLDQTGLTGNYDLVLNKREKQDMEDESAPDPRGESSRWDMEALGLKLVPMKVPTRRLVIDHIERPSAN
jgi:uncharacterized protein (TIGR03435 family)